MKTLEDLLEYLEANQDIEQPFNPEAWERAVAAVEGKERKFKETIVRNFDGTEVKKKIPNGPINPVSKYFQLMALPQYQTKPSVISEDVDAEGPVDFASFQKGLNKDDRAFVESRLNDYYENYDLNSGSDRFIVQQVVMLELYMQKANAQLLAGKSDVNKLLKEYTDQYIKLSDALNSLKKNRKHDQEGASSFTAYLDELEKNGELVVNDDYDDDAIDKMLKQYRDSIKEVYGAG